ncbi:cutinase [Thozetella sp. PMI_491]|nr:cutinase [Thozetella sp. PMI_491]
MKSIIVSLLVSLQAVSALPSDYATLEGRQIQTTSNDLKNGACKDVTFIMARGSTETGNMGQIPGPPTCSGLKQQLGADKVACQGVGTEDGYPATLQANFQPKNTQDSAIKGAVDMVNLAATKCPNSQIVMGGYSQGSAVVDNAIQQMGPAMAAKVKGVVLFGYTRNAQDNAQIPGYPKAQTKIFCANGDLVCDNTLTITAAHLTYAQNAPEASKFLASMVQA